MKPKIEDSKDGVIKEKIKMEDGKEKGDSDQEMMNLENEIYSLTHYADDEEELVAQMFATIKGSKLDTMMPPILKEIPLIDVQQLCLHELRGMSQRRILSIINGQEMSGSSSEDSEDDLKPSKMQDENDDFSMGGRPLEDADDLLEGKDLTEMENTNLTALDILELEMRAKLIKTMLEKQDGDDDDDEDDKDATNGLFDPNIKIKEEPLTPESKRKEDGSPASRHKSKYFRRRKGRRARSGSRSYSSSSRSSYSSRSRSYSRSGSSRSRSYSSDKKRDVSGSPDSKKAEKKKITKKEFEERMKKAKMNRSYRKRKESEDESGGEKSKRKLKPKKKEESTDKVKEEKEGMVGDAGLPEEDKPSQPTEVEEGEDKEVAEEKEEVAVEKEEGEIDSNEEGAYSSHSRSSRSRSRSYSSYSSYSSRSRSYSRSPRRRKSKKSKSKKKKYRRNRSRSLSDVPKIPNWKPEKSEVKLDNSEEVSISKTEPETTLPEERESISFSFNKKSNLTTSTGLTEDGLPNIKPAQDEEKTEETNLDVNENADNSAQEEGSETLSVESRLPITNELSYTPPPKGSKPTREEAERGEFSEDFYKGADQLSFSEEEGECEDDVELQKFMDDDTPVEILSVGDSVLRKSLNVVSNKNEPPAASWESKKKKERKVDMAMEGVGFLKTALSESRSNVDSPMEDDVSVIGVLEDSTQDVLEPLPETEPEADDSMDSHNVEIIGVIDPTENQDAPFDEELAAGGSSWSMRWLQSEKVQKVVSNSTLLSKVRKKIQARGKSKAIVKELPQTVVPKQQVEVKPKPIATPKIEIKPPQPAKSSSVIGSMEEYEKLVGIKVNAPTSLPQPKTQSKAVIQAVSLLDSGDDDDSEDDAIWSKILKK